MNRCVRLSTKTSAGNDTDTLQGEIFRNGMDRFSLANLCFEGFRTN